MYLYLLLWLVICTEALSHWEPCKLQCDNNFKRNEISQPTLINVCKRGCDLFTVALISTSHPSSSVSKNYPNMHPKVLPRTAVTYQEHNEVVIMGHPLKGEKVSVPLTVNNEVPRSSDVVKIEPPNNTISEILKKAIIGNAIPIFPSIRIEGTTMINSIKASHLENPSKVGLSQDSSKTTEEPISQPVQDHPVEAGKQTTTPKGPKREHSKLATPQRKKLAPMDTPTMNAIHPNAIQSDKNELSKADKLAISVRQDEPFHDDTMEQRIEQAKHSCRHACITAYKDGLEQEACVVGCHLQATTASLKPSDEEKIQQPRSPIAVFQHVVFSLAHHVGRLVRVTWSLASSSPATDQEGPSPGNKMQVYGSELMTRQAQVPIFVGLRQSFNEANKSPDDGAIDASNGIAIMNGGLFHLQRPIDPSNSVNGHLNMPDIITIIKEETKDVHSKLTPPNHEEKEKHFQEQLKKMENVLDVISDSNKRSKDDSLLIDHQDSQPQLDLLECISRKSGLPRWFIAIAIFASALVVLWLCFSLTAPPDDIKVVKRKPDISECLLEDDDDDYYDDNLSCSEKKKLLARADDVIKIRIENV